MDKTMANKFMYIPDDDTQNYPFFRLQVMVEMFLHSTLLTNESKFNKSQQIVKPTRKKYKTLGTGVIKSPMSPPFMFIPNLPSQSMYKLISDYISNYLIIYLSRKSSDSGIHIQPYHTSDESFLQAIIKLTRYLTI